MVDREKRDTIKKLGIGGLILGGAGGGAAYVHHAIGEEDDRIDPERIALSAEASIQEKGWDTVVPPDNVQVALEPTGSRVDGEGNRYTAVATGYLRPDRVAICDYDVSNSYEVYELADELEDAATMMFTGLYAELQHFLPQAQDGEADVIDRYVVAFDQDGAAGEAAFDHEEIRTIAGGNGKFVPDDSSRDGERFRSMYKPRFTARCEGP